MSRSHSEITITSDSASEATQSLLWGSPAGVRRLGAGPRIGVFLLAVALAVASLAFGSNDDSSSTPATNSHQVSHR